MDVNIHGPWYLARKVLPHMRKRGRGVVVNISSYAPDVGGAGLETPYAVSKGALNTLTRCIAHEGGPFGIRANTVSMGMVEGTKFVMDHPELRERHDTTGPAGVAGAQGRNRRRGGVSRVSTGGAHHRRSDQRLRRRVYAQLMSMSDLTSARREAADPWGEWAGSRGVLMSYAYLASRPRAVDRTHAENLLEIRPDLRTPTGAALAAPLAIAMLDTAGINVDPVNILALHRSM